MPTTSEEPPGSNTPGIAAFHQPGALFEKKIDYHDPICLQKLGGVLAGLMNHNLLEEENWRFDLVGAPGR